MRHHTKDKGDQGLGFVLADLMKNHIHVALPISEHLPFDCIAISEEGLLRRVSVKYRSLKKGVIEVQRRSVWTSGGKVRVKPHKPHSYDILAIYCPDTDKCYYLKESDLVSKTILTLRVETSRNNQTSLCTFARDFEGTDNIFR
jgi:hypothetical protein